MDSVAAREVFDSGSWVRLRLIHAVRSILSDEALAGQLAFFCPTAWQDSTLLCSSNSD